MEYKVTDTELTSVANAIRTKGNTSELLQWPNGYVTAVQNILTEVYEDYDLEEF